MSERIWNRRQVCAGLAMAAWARKLSAADDQTRPLTLFDGKSLNGWHGNEDVWSVNDGRIVGKHRGRANNEFLSTTDEFGDFILSLRFRLHDGIGNSGVQFRSQRIPNHHEMIGYQADVGEQYWGCLYDESRRRKVLAGPTADVREQAVKPADWNTYVIRCQGLRIILELNGIKTVDYTETDTSLPMRGKIALQIHSHPKPVTVEFADIHLTPLSSET